MSGLSLSEQNRLRLVDLAVCLQSSLPADSEMFPSITSSIASLSRSKPKLVEILEEDIPYIPSCFKADIDQLRQAEGASWTEGDIRLLSETLKEVGVAVSPHLRPFIA